MQRVAIFGVGLIGGSFALALKEVGFDGEIVGVSGPSTIEKAVRQAVVSRGVPFEEAARTCDILYLAQPIDQILVSIKRLSKLVTPGQIVTDAGSTKVAIAEAAKEWLPEKVFVGGHPMAGKELRGVEHAEASLFRNRPYVLTGKNENLETWLVRIGAHVVHLSPEEHDRIVARTSHVPQLLSSALASFLESSPIPSLTQLAGPGLLDMTRLALSDPAIWESIIRTNREQIANALGEFAMTLEQVRSQLTVGDVSTTFVSGHSFASKIRPS